MLKGLAPLFPLLVPPPLRSDPGAALESIPEGSRSLRRGLAPSRRSFSSLPWMGSRLLTCLPPLTCFPVALHPLPPPPFHQSFGVLGSITSIGCRCSLWSLPVPVLFSASFSSRVFSLNLTEASVLPDGLQLAMPSIKKKKKKKSPALLSATPSEPLFDSCTLLRGHIAGRACSCLLPSPQPPTRSQLFIGGDCVSLAFVFTVVATWVLSNCFNLNLSPCSRANGLLCLCVCDFKFSAWYNQQKILWILVSNWVNEFLLKKRGFPF